MVAREAVSEIVKSFNHLTLLVKHGKYKPILCFLCGRHVTRIAQNLKVMHELEGDVYEDTLEECQEASKNGEIFFIVL